MLFAAGLLSYPPVMQAYLMDHLPNESMGGDLGAMRSVYISLGSTGPTVAGVIADLSSFDVAFTVLAGCLLVSAVLIRSSTRQVDAG